MRTMVQFIVFGIGACALLVSAMFVFQRHLMYRPGLALPQPGETLLASATVRRIQSEPGLELTSWYVAPAADKPVIVYFQGNAATIAERDFKVAPWAEAGYGVWLLGYRGFGGNPGKPTEAGLYADAAATIAALARDGIMPAQIILYGESLGTGVATQVAATLADAGTPVKGVVLEAPFSSMGAAAQGQYPFLPAKWLVRDRYDSLSKIVRIAAPLLLVHGDQDRVVAQKLGRQLFAAASEPKQAVWIAGAGHSNLYDFGLGERVRLFFDEL